MRFTVSFLTAIVLAVQVSAQQFVGFSGDSCNGGEGTVVGCSGECIGFSDRHSFQVLGGSADVIFFTNTDCTGESFNFGTEGNDECINVNTGTPIGSAICG